MRSGNVCSSVALDVLMLSWFYQEPATRTHTVTNGTKARAWSAAAVVPLPLHCCIAASCFCGC